MQTEPDNKPPKLVVTTQGFPLGVDCTLNRRGFKWIFRYGEPETPPVPSRLWLFGMYVVM